MIFLPDMCIALLGAATNEERSPEVDQDQGETPSVIMVGAQVYCGMGYKDINNC